MEPYVPVSPNALAKVRAANQLAAQQLMFRNPADATEPPRAASGPALEIPRLGPGSERFQSAEQTARDRLSMAYQRDKVAQINRQADALERGGGQESGERCECCNQLLPQTY